MLFPWANVSDSRVINPFELVKSFITIPKCNWHIRYDDIYSWDQTVNPYGRDKLEEYKINTLKPRKYGGTLSWLAADGEDTEQTDGIAASEAIKKLDYFDKTDIPFLAVAFLGPIHLCSSKNTS